MAQPGKNFRALMLSAERRRAEVLSRLERLPPHSRAHPGFNNVRKLLCGRFATIPVAKRLAVIQSAEWLMNVLESLPFV